MLGACAFVDLPMEDLMFSLCFNNDAMLVTPNSDELLCNKKNTLFIHYF